MTRELKLALIIAVTLVLGVLVLVSDHLSVQRRPKLADSVSVQPERTPPPPVVEAPSTPAVAEPLKVTEPKVSETKLADALTKEEPVVEIMQGESRKVAKADDELRKAVEARGGTIDEQGNVRIPPLATAKSEAIKAAPEFAKASRETSPDIADQFAARPPVKSAESGKVHTVVSGDSAFKIARQYLGDGKYWKKIIDANPKAFAADGQVKLGSRIVIPAMDVPGPTKAAPVTKPAPTRLAAKPATKKPYTIRKGDTLHGIAKRELGSSQRADEILKLNKSVIKDPAALAVGVAIVLPTEE